MDDGEPRRRVLTGVRPTGPLHLKRRLVTVLERVLAPIRERRRYVEARPLVATEALQSGSALERRVAPETMEAVRDALQLDYVTRASA